MSMSNASAKTIFLLDHTHWMREGSGVQIEIENGAGGGGQPTGRGSRGGGLNYFTSFIPPVTKSLWTYAVETVLEYSRVVLDLFADERLLRFALCQGQQGKLVWLNNWDQTANGSQQQSLAYISEMFANAGTPMMANKGTSSIGAIQLGIKSAIEALAQPTPAQIAFMNGSGGYNKSLKAINKGRVICITSCTPDSVGKASAAEDLQDFFLNALNQHNRIIAPSSDHLLPIHYCEFVLISCHPIGKENLSRVLSRPLQEVSPIFKSEVHVASADRICEKMMTLLATHHDLISTIVTGIPMKEEQSALQSSNYDVPLWHSRMSTSNIDSSILKWSSPSAPKTVGVGAGANGLVHHCISACRVTPVDVNSRPSTCLSTFVVNGRSVWLEMPKKGKTTSHMLTPHGGEMWMHIIETARNVLEDPPSISEGIGGRVTDYRIHDYAEFIKMNMLIPYPKNYQDNVVRSKGDREGHPFVRRRSSSIEDDKKPIEMAKARLLRKSAYWPMTIGGSLLFPMQVHIESLLGLMIKDSINEAEREECFKCIWSLMSLEARGEPPIPSSHHKKGQKRDEQWRAVYAELETFIRSNQHSEQHKKVLECFLESRRADTSGNKNDEKTSRLKDPNIDKALAEMASLNGPVHEVTDSPMSPPPANSSKSVCEVAPVNKKSLLALWTAKTEKKDLRVLTNTKLYSHLATAGDSDRKTDAK